MKISFAVTTCVASCALIACLAPPVTTPPTTVLQVSPISVRQNAQQEVDVLFMIDNSPSMDAMQAQLIARFPQFLQVFSDVAHPTDDTPPLYPDMHIGVVTSDYGAGHTTVGNCEASPGGQKGLLQAKGAAADASCAAPTGASFIKYAFGAGGDSCNLPGGCTPTALGQAFTCMASVGLSGCGFEHQLESVYAALQNGGAANPGFLRPEALLAVVFVTNEDDGSAPPSTLIYDQSTTEKTPTGVPLGAYLTYRQSQFGVACGSPLSLLPYGASMGALAGCEGAPIDSVSMIGDEYETSRYIDFFTKPGSVKADPLNNVILVGIDAPATPVETILAEPTSGGGKMPNPAYVPCEPPISASCIVALQHSCQNAVQPAFFGDPAVRLNEVIGKTPLNQIADICGADPMQAPDYTTALQKVAALISIYLKPGCIPAPLPDPANPQCVVVDVTTNADGTQTQAPIPECNTVTGNTTCWSVETNPLCAPPASPQGLSVVVNRHGQEAPPMSSASVQCDTTACPPGMPDC